MSRKEFKNKLVECFEVNGYSDLLNDEAVDKFEIFADFLVETNKVMNLTAITDDNGVILKHFLDCASISALIPENSSLVDVGCGAGFPSIPLAIVRSDVRITSIDSTAKRIAFVKDSAEKLGLTNVSPVCVRAEDFAALNFEKFDISTSRAVARLNVLSELCLPLTKVGGKFIAMKSNKGQEEFAEAKNGIGFLGGMLESENSGALSYGEISVEREVFVFLKSKKTPKGYPRKYAQILKKPL